MLPVRLPFDVKYDDEFEDEAIILQITQQGISLDLDIIIKNIQEVSEKNNVEYVRIYVTGKIDDQEISKLIDRIKDQTLVNVFGYKKIA